MPVDYSSLTRRARPRKRVIVAIAGAAGAAGLAVGLFVSSGGGTVSRTASVATATTTTLRPGIPMAASSVQPSSALALAKILPTGERAAPTVTAPLSPAPTKNPWLKLTIRKGQTLSTLFADAGLPAGAWIPVIKAGGDAAELRRLRVGAPMQMEIVNHQLVALRYPLDKIHTLQVSREADGYTAKTLTATLTKKRTIASGVIDASLFDAGQRAGLTDRQVMAFAHIFAAQVDFGRDIHAGDRFTVIYDRTYTNGKRLGSGRILAAEIQTGGQVYRAVRYTNKAGVADYFTPDGHSLHRMFLRTPVDFTRISSSFSLHRMNPVLHIVRPHYGTDFAAPMGTPIHATASGRIAFIGRDGGYGNCVKIKSGSKYETIYGHMSRFRHGLHRGSRIKQDEVIGYVGMTGLATGPHVHYEIRVNGVPKNPMTIKLPNGAPLPASERHRFTHQTATLVAALDNASTLRYAANGPTIGTR